MSAVELKEKIANQLEQLNEKQLLKLEKKITDLTDPVDPEIGLRRSLILKKIEEAEESIKLNGAIQWDEFREEMRNLFENGSSES